ncbi:MAG: hypothetical protein MUE30_06065 [Spirosomaceae bacterium]|nr:hypothetical protein [Spirosomataceae bacterium]
MKVAATIAFLCTCCALDSTAQQEAVMNQTTRDLINMRGLLLPSSNTTTLFGIKVPKGDVVGDPYIDVNWQKGDCKLYRKIGPPGREGDSISNVPLRYDLYSQELEIKVDNSAEVRVIGSDMLAMFTTNTPVPRMYLNTREFKSEDELKGFVEVVKMGARLSLFEYPKLTIIKPTYNEALSSGSRDTKITKTPQYYYLRGRTLFKLGTSKKKILEAMPDRADDVEKFIKANDFDLKSRAALIQIVDYYNSL